MYKKIFLFLLFSVAVFGQTTDRIVHERQLYDSLFHVRTSIIQLQDTTRTSERSIVGVRINYSSGCTPNGGDQGCSIDNVQSFQNAIDSINGRGVIIAEKGVIPLNSITIPDFVTLKLMPGAIIQVQSGQTLTINGNIDAGLYQIFDTTGTVDLSSAKIEKVYPEWFGAVTDTSIDSYTAVQKAVNSISTGVIQLSKGQYKVTQPIVLTGAVQLKGLYGGYEPISTIINDCTNQPAIIVKQAVDYSRGTGIADLNVWAGTNTSKGILIHNVRFCEFKNLGIRDFSTGYGITAMGDTTGDPDNAGIQNRFDKIFISGCKYGLVLSGQSGNNTSSNDESLFSDINIQLLPTIHNDVGLWIKKSMSNLFLRLTINKQSQYPTPDSTTIGIKFDDHGADINYCTRDALFLGTTMEGVYTPIVFSPNCHNNRFESVHILNFSQGTMVIDSSGGGNYISSIGSGETLQRSSSYFTPSTFNLLENTQMESWSAGFPMYWYSNDTTRISQSSDSLFGHYSAKMTRGSVSDIYMYQNIASADLAALKGRYLSFGSWIKVNKDSCAEVRIFTNVAGVTGVKQSLWVKGDGKWHYTTVRLKIPATATYVAMGIVLMDKSNAVAYVDGSYASMNFDVPMYADKKEVDPLPISGLLKFSGSTNAYPALKRNGNSLEVRTAGDSTYAPLTAGSFIATQPSALMQGVYIGGWDKASIDSAVVKGDSLFFYIGANKYNAIKGTALPTHGYMLKDSTAYTMTIGAANTPVKFTPGLSVQEADSITFAPDSVIIKQPGDYEMEFSSVISGTNGDPIRFRLYKNSVLLTPVSSPKITITATGAFHIVSWMWYIPGLVRGDRISIYVLNLGGARNISVYDTRWAMEKKH